VKQSATGIGGLMCLPPMPTDTVAAFFALAALNC